MVRPRKYPRAELLDRALVQFFEHGFAALSVRALTASLDISPSTLYADFGGKEGLFAAVLQHYEATTRRTLEPLAEPDGGLSAVERFLYTLTEPDRRAGHELHGCLVANTLPTRSVLPEALSILVTAHLDRQRVALEAAFRIALRQGELRADLAPRQAADLTLVVVQGLLVTMTPAAEQPNTVTGTIATFVDGLRGTEHA